MRHEAIVIGNGWTALGAIGSLVTQGVSPLWLAGSGTRLVAPLPILGVGPGAESWERLTAALGIELSSLPEVGSFMREFRNKAFREPSWTKAPTPESRLEVQAELLWEPEQVLSPVFECWPGESLADLEEKIRTHLLQDRGVTRIEGVPVSEVTILDDTTARVRLASGQEFTTERLLWADVDSPKVFGRLKHKKTYSALQAMFTHLGLGDVPLRQGFFCNLHRDAGEEFQRSVWGYFLDGGRRSVWTLLLDPEEVEDNHTIAKKFRRLKQSLERIFAGASFLPAGKTDLIAAVTDEQVRFEENVIWTSSEVVTDALRTKQCSALGLLTDGYGPGPAMQAALNWAGEPRAILKDESITPALSPEV